MRIADYAFLSDCQSAALVGLDGSVDWYCVPRFDSPSVFARLLDPHAGHWRIRPQGEYRATRGYLEDSLVLHTVFQTAKGAVSVTDALGLDPLARGHDIGLRVPHELLRRVECIDGVVDVEMEFAPRFEYGLTQPALEWKDGGVRATGGPVELTLESDAPVICGDKRAHGAYLMRKGDAFTYRLRYRDSYVDPTRVSDSRASIEDTYDAWRSWAEIHRGYTGRYMGTVRRSSLVLQGLTYQPSGPVAAAPTTSLPEVLGGTANWDYRYAWLRGASFTVAALRVGACAHEPTRFLRWIEQAGGGLEDKPVQIVYGVAGERDLTEHKLDNLEGYESSKPVRVGNDAWSQRQLDVLGEVVGAAYLLRDDIEFDRSTRDLVRNYADRAARDWRVADAGIWEARDRERHYTSSKVICWVALDRAVRLAGRLQSPERETDAWARARDDIRATVLDQAWSDEAGAYTGSFGSPELDASVLLLPLVGFLPAIDERMRATIEAIERSLAVDGLVRRWPAERNSFVTCSYWLAECLALAGENERATRIFERVTSLANDVGLLAQEVDPETGELLGNFPHTLSHVALVNTAGLLSMGGEGAAAFGADTGWRGGVTG